MGRGRQRLSPVVEGKGAKMGPDLPGRGGRRAGWVGPVFTDYHCVLVRVTQKNKTNMVR